MDQKECFDCIDLLIRINRAHKKMIEENVSTKIGLHRTQHIILMKLAKNDSLPSQKELCEHIGVSAAAISGALKKLEDGGFIVRKIGNDNRFNQVTITEQGKAVVSETEKIFAEIDRGLFESFSQEEIAIFKEFLEKINKNTKIQGP